MADIKKVFDETLKLDRGIQSLLSFSAFERNGDLSGLHIDFDDSEQLFLTEELREIMEKLSDVHFRLKYLSRPVRETGRLHKNGAAGMKRQAAIIIPAARGSRP